MVARLLREQEVVGSSPVASTTLPNKPFLLVWLFCCVRLTKKPNVALGAVWQTSFYGMLNFVTLRELSSLAAPSLPLLASPVASTNVETRLFCKESAFLRTLFAFCRFLLLPESSLSGVPFFFKPFLLVWLFCCVRLTKKPNVALGAVWQTSFYGMLNFVTLRELSSLAAPSLPLLASPVASTNVETRLFCKESAFLRTLFAFCRFLLLPESSLSGFPFFISHFYLCCAPI